jgi:hypothetical protein
MFDRGLSVVYTTLWISRAAPRPLPHLPYLSCTFPLPLHHTGNILPQRHVNDCRGDDHGEFNGPGHLIRFGYEDHSLLKKCGVR